MKSEYLSFFSSPLGKIGIVENNDKVSHLFFDDENKEFSNFIVKETPLLKEVVKQLVAYFNQQLTRFNIPLDLQGTEFQVQVWNALQEIPFGKTCTYKEIATQIGNPAASRAVGQANHRNAIPIIIPCHRVIQSSGKLGGYAYGTTIKKSLLDLEKNA